MVQKEKGRKISLTLKYDILRAVIIMQTLSTAPAVMSIVAALRRPAADVIPMIWRQTQKDWDNGRPWLSAARQKTVYYISYTDHGWTAYSGWVERPTITETDEKRWIDEVRMGWKPEVENAAIPSNKRHDNSYKGLDYMALVSKQLGCRIEEIYGLLEQGEVKVCTAPGCDQRIKRAAEFYSRNNQCKKCRKRGRNERS